MELLEFSIVNIPSNPNALRRTVEKDEELDRIAELTEEVGRLGAQIMAQGREIDFFEEGQRYYRNREPLRLIE